MRCAKIVNPRSRQICIWILALPLTNLWNLPDNNLNSNGREDKLHKNILPQILQITYPIKIPFRWMQKGLPHGTWSKVYWGESQGVKRQ